MGKNSDQVTDTCLQRYKKALETQNTLYSPSRHPHNPYPFGVVQGNGFQVNMFQ
jgi:hypothetical protein